MTANMWVKMCYIAIQWIIMEWQRREETINIHMKLDYLSMSCAKWKGYNKMILFIW